jgi:uncharacterized protein involved in exopolysaccharide biosynthesis
MIPRAQLLVAGFRRHGRRPFLAVLAVAVLAVGVSLLMPSWYRAESSLMPPQDSGEGFGALASLVEASALSKVGLLSTNSTSDLYVEMIKSRRVRESIVRRFELQRRYKIKNLDDCLKELDHHLTVGAERSKIILIQVEDRDARVASDMANAFVTELDSLNQEIQIERATRSRAYLEQQVEAAQVRLHDAERRLSDYERASGVVTGSGTEASAVQGAADLLARRLALQVRKSWMESYLEPQNPALEAVRSELDAIDREVARLPGIKQEASRRTLDVEIQRRVFLLLTAQLEGAKLEEQRRVSSVSVLDPARPATRHVRPRRAIIVAIATAAAALLAGAWVLHKTREDLAAQAPAA